MDGLNIIEFLAGMIDSDGWRMRSKRKTGLVDIRYAVETTASSLFKQILDLGVGIKEGAPQTTKSAKLLIGYLSKELSLKVNEESVYLSKRLRGYNEDSTDNKN